MEITLEEFLNLLADSNQPIPLEHLELLSDLDSDRTRALTKRWLFIPQSRRASLLEHCGKQAEENIKFLFDALNRFALDDPISKIRVQAIQNLWECESPELIPTLAAMVNSAEREEERAAAAKALGPFMYRSEVNEIPAPLHTEMESVLLRSVQNDPSPDVRRKSLESLGYSSHRSVADLIQSFFRDGDDQDRIAALTAMGRSADARWNDIVLEHLNDSTPEIRIHAASAAGELEIGDAVDDLIDLLEDVDDRIQNAAIWALGQIGGDSAREALLFLEQSDDPDLVELVQAALEHLAFVDGSDDFLLLDYDEEQGPPH